MHSDCQPLRLPGHRLHAQPAGKRADIGIAWRYLIPVGFIGAYSTFSTYEWETLSILRSGAFVLAALYAGGSLVLGLLAVWAGSMLGEAL